MRTGRQYKQRRQNNRRKTTAGEETVNKQKNAISKLMKANRRMKPTKLELLGLRVLGKRRGVMILVRKQSLTIKTTSPMTTTKSKRSMSDHYVELRVMTARRKTMTKTTDGIVTARRATGANGEDHVEIMIS